MTALVIIFVILVIFAGYFGSAETAFSAMNKIRIKNMAEEGNKKAKKAIFISNNFDTALTTLLIGGNIAHIGASSVATVIALRLYEKSLEGTVDKGTVTVLCTVITTIIVFLFGEMIPKSLANDRSDTLAVLYAGSLRLLMKIFTPLNLLFGGITKLFNKLFSSEPAPSITEDELYDIIDTIEEEGVVDGEQGDLLKSALDFSGITAADVMTMRSDISAIDIGMTNDKIIEFIKNTNHSRIPVYSGDIDHIVGMLLIRNFLKAYRRNPRINLRSLISEPFFVSANENIDDLLSVMRQHKITVAIVRDEDNRTLGIVTIEDFLEELVGEIWDEDDVYDEKFINLGGNRYQIDARMTVGSALSRMGCICKDKRLAAKPILAWVFETFGRFPEEEESFRYGLIEVTVDTVEDNKVTKVVFKLNTDALSKSKPVISDDRAVVIKQA